MALQRVETDAIQDDAVTTAKIAANAVAAADIAADAITNVKVAAGAAIAVAKISGLGTAATLTAGTAANNVVQLDGSGRLPAVSGANLTGVSTDTSAMENNIAILAFKTQTANNLAKFNLIDQVIDEYYDATGIDASASTGEVAGGSGIAKYYQGGTSSTPTVTHDADATGTDGDYTWYKWTDTGSTGSFSINAAQTIEYLIVAGGGAGGRGNSGGGGAGGLIATTDVSYPTGTPSWTVTVGTGGVGPSSNGIGGNGANSILSGTGLVTQTAIGGGGGAYTGIGAVGGSGGGNQYNQSQTPAAGTAGQGNSGGSASGTAPQYGAAGGGGAYAVGGNGSGPAGGAGGAGLQNDITGTNLYYAGGGGGSTNYSTAAAGAGGLGGGGQGCGNDGSITLAQLDGDANTGGGGGGAYVSLSRSGHGGTGVVIIRKLTNVEVAGGNLTLQSVANTALTAPTTGDICMLIENSSGTATLNTDIKAWVSRNGGSGWDQATLVDKGTWGSGTKKILTSNNVAFSNSASGTDMRYKITTHNQSLGSKETRVHATSLAWA